MRIKITYLTRLAQCLALAITQEVAAASPCLQAPPHSYPEHPRQASTLMALRSWNPPDLSEHHPCVSTCLLDRCHVTKAFEEKGIFLFLFIVFTGMKKMCDVYMVAEYKESSLCPTVCINFMCFPIYHLPDSYSSFVFLFPVGNVGMFYGDNCV